MKVSMVGGIYVRNYKSSSAQNCGIERSTPCDSFISSSIKPSFGDDWVVDKKKFNVLEASDSELKYLGEVFRNADETRIEEACKKKYQGFFSDHSELAAKKLRRSIAEAQKKMTELNKNIAIINARLKIGDIGVENAKNTLQTDYISKIDKEQSGNAPEKLPNGILILNDGQERVSLELRCWLKDKSKVNYSLIDRMLHSGRDLASELESKLNLNKKIYDYTGIRSLVELQDVDYIFDKTSILNHTNKEKLYELMKNASEKYKTTILYIAPRNYNNIEQELFSKEHFDLQIKLNDGERPKDRDILWDLESSKAKMKSASEDLDNYIYYEFSDLYNDGSSDDVDHRDDFRNRM